MPKKKVEFPEDNEEDEDKGKYEEVWDFKKIIIGVVIVLLLIAGGLVAKRLYFHESISPSSFVPKVSFPSVKGSATGPSDTTQITHMKISLPSQQEVQSQIQNIQQQVTHLDLNEIASSTPQVKEILQQIQDLPKEGTSQVQQACMRLCGNL